MPFIARQRSRLAVLAVLALVGSLLAVSAVPVAADDGTVDNPARYSACVEAATADAKFGDMAGSFAEAAANCLAHYGITTGTAAGVFSPNASITRLQMALFLTRAAGPAGIVLPAASDQGLTDIGGMTQGIQDAINQAAALGIMSPRSAGVFDPTGMVTREDMAVHLAGFLSDATTGPGGHDIDKKGWSGDDTVLTDISGVTYSAYGAIRDLYDLGVTTGTSDTTFSPSALVSRGQMAVFITRALAHTNARPAGLSMQAPSSGAVNGNADLQISVRDAAHQPVPDALVDIFTSGTPDENFDADGMCESETLGRCVIQDDDTATEPDGNTSTASVGLLEDAGTLTVWAWTGEVDDKFDLGDMDYVSAEIDVALGAKETKVTDDKKADATSLKFGDTITYTFQLVDENGDPVAEADSEVTVIATIEDTTEDPNRPTENTTETDYMTDASGRIQVSFSQDDPDPDNDDQDVIKLTLQIIADVKVSGDEKPEVTWIDDASVATTLTLGQAVEYHDADSAGVRHTVTATLVDQYGDPVKGVKIKLSSGANGKGLGKDSPERTTNSSGVATKSYTSTLVDSDEKIEAVYSPEEGKKVEANIITHYWASQLLGISGTDNEDAKNSSIVAVDINNNVVVVNVGGKIKWVSYKGTDQLNISTGAVNLEGFEKVLGVEDPTVLKITARIGDDADDINVITVS